MKREAYRGFRRAGMRRCTAAPGFRPRAGPGNNDGVSPHGTDAYRDVTGLPPLVARAVSVARQAGFGSSCLPAHGRLLQLLAGGVGAGVIGETGTGCGVGLAWLPAGPGPASG
jgi:hypothetical protein